MKNRIAVLLIVLATAMVTGTELPQFQQPVLITSAGQSAEVQIVSVLAKRAGIEAVLNKMAPAEDLAEQNPSTIMLVIGVSMKGMGAAGLDIEEEKGRVDALLDKADELSIPILCLHLGGESRRGELSDAVIAEYVPRAAAVLVAKSGNTDGFFNSLCESRSIPLIEVDRAADALIPLKNLFHIETQ
jgi:hypothetical protein